jgi:hypothetical protein
MTRPIRAFVARNVLFAVAVLATVLFGAARASETPLQTYHYLVFSNPTEGQESEYDRWYDAQHVPDVLSVPGFVSAERFRLNDVQMYPGVKVAMPRYLVSYIIRTSDIDAVMKEVMRRLQAGETVISPSFDKKTSLAYVYRATTPFQRTTPDPTRDAAGDRVDYLHIVFTVPREDRLDRFDPWYDEVHAPSMMRGPGYTSAQRSVLAQPAKFASIEPSEAIAMFRLSLPADMPIDKAREVPRPDAVPASEILDFKRNRGYSYRRITPVVMAAPIQAERAARPKAKAEPDAASKSATIALNDGGAGNCRALFSRITTMRHTSADEQNALMEEAEESGCLE